MGHGCRWGLTAAIRAIRALTARPRLVLRGPIARDLGRPGAACEILDPFATWRIRAPGRPVPVPALSDRGPAWMPRQQLPREGLQDPAMGWLGAARASLAP